MKKTANINIHPLMNLPGSPEVFDFTSGYNPDKIYRVLNSGKWGIGGYLEKRKGMYTAPQYGNTRNIHVGIDIWANAGEQVFAALDGEVAYMENNDEEGNYGPTIVLKHSRNGNPLYSLHGHLSLHSLRKLNIGDNLSAGDVVGELGNESENGNWPPHLHYQLCRIDPGKADMPGVVSVSELNRAKEIYPDPRIILGPVY